jgi:hypothetical protein
LLNSCIKIGIADVPYFQEIAEFFLFSDAEKPVKHRISSFYEVVRQRIFMVL